MQAIDNFGGRHFLYMKRSGVNLGKLIMNLRNEYAKGESSKLQVASAAKKKDLQPICGAPNLIGYITSTMRRILLERGSKRAWRNVRSNQIKNVCWLLERQDVFEN